eukprot:gene12643-10844_t
MAIAISDEMQFLGEPVLRPLPPVWDAEADIVATVAADGPPQVEIRSPASPGAQRRPAVSDADLLDYGKA